jgi:hypothetical protein
MMSKLGWTSRRSVLAGVAAAAAGGGVCAAQSLGMTRDMKIRIAFGGNEIAATLEDNPSARDLFTLLPLDLSIDDYSTNEKIAYLPRKLTEQGSGPFGNEAPGDICYYAPWGNLALFHAVYRWSSGLIRLGRMETIEPLRIKGKFALRVEPIA